MQTLTENPPVVEQPESRAVSVRLYCLLGAAAVLAVALYLYPSSGYFLYDDARMILLNRPSDASHLARAFIELRDNFYRPVYEVAVGLEWMAFGSNPFGYHLANVVAHLLTGAAVYLLAGLLLGRQAALVAATFFLANVAHAEPVIWISGLHSELPALLAVGAFASYVQADRDTSRTSVGYYAAALLIWLLALLAKESAYTVPLLIAAYHLMLSPHPKWVVARRLVPFLALMAVYAPLRLSQGTGYPLEALDLGPLALTKNVLSYMVSAFVPLPDDYRFLASLPLWRSEPLLPATMLMLGLVSFALLVRAGLVAALSRERAAVFGVLWLLVTLLPILPIYAERELYLPSVGAAIAVGAVVGRCLRLSRPGRPGSLVGGALALLLAANLLGLAERSYWWKSAGDLSRQISQAVVDGAALTRSGSRLVVLGVPDKLRATHVQGPHFPWTVHLASDGAIPVESVLIGSYRWPAPENATRTLPSELAGDLSATVIDLRVATGGDGFALSQDR